MEQYVTKDFSQCSPGKDDTSLLAKFNFGRALIVTVLLAQYKTCKQTFDISTSQIPVYFVEERMKTLL